MIRPRIDVAVLFKRTALFVRGPLPWLIRYCLGGLRTSLVSLAFVFVCGVTMSIGQDLEQRRADQLPSESRLPNEGGQRDLPDESALPGRNKTPNRGLPGEVALPGEQRPQQEQNAEEEELAPIGGRSPILRLSFEGHTGAVRTLDLSDGGRTLITGGEDKDLHVWRRTDINPEGWLHRRTIRWPVTRGPRGLIYAARLKGDLAAFAGYGAFGYRGEIRIVDVASGELQRTLFDPQSGHLSNVVGVAWSPGDTLRLASVDVEGRLIIWQADPVTGLWSGKTWVDVDSVEYSPELAQELQLYERRSFVPIAFLGDRRIVVPRFVEFKEEPQGIASWHLELVDLETGNRKRLTQLDHLRHVRSLTSSLDGRVLVSSEYDGAVGIWKFNDAGEVTASQQIRPSRPPLFVRLDEKGERLLVGTEQITLEGENGEGNAAVEVWDLQADSPVRRSVKLMSQNVTAGILDRDHGEVIVAQGNELEVVAIDSDGRFPQEQTHRLAATVHPVTKVAFRESADSYQIAFGWERDEQGNKLLHGVFDLRESKLLGRGPINAEEFLSPQRTNERWDVGGIMTDSGPRFQLFEQGQPRGVLPLDIDLHGVCTARCTLPAPATGTEEPGEIPTTGAVIVGTAGENGIYAYAAGEENPPRLLRQFRDHSGAITSVSTSADGNYLVSAGADSKISIWNLQELFTASVFVNRWGCEFEIENNTLIASNVREAGPLYFRGVREGDRLILMEWTDNQAEPFVQADPQKMLERLRDLPFDSLVHLKFSRRGRPGPDFQSYPAWRPLATLFVDQGRSWAYWTPAGFYDASFNGHQLFGWQINHDIDQPVDYFRAAQFRKRLERPDVMRKLLDAGSLPAAMRQTLTQIGPPPGDDAIVNQIKSKPTIELLEPKLGSVIEGDRMRVRARITAPRGAALVEPRAFVSGVAALGRRVVGRDPDANAVVYEWMFGLPRDSELQLELLAATESEALERLRVDLSHRPGALVSKPRLHVLAIGASQYRDPQIQSLDFAADATEKILKLFTNASGGLYRTSGDRLIDRDATRPMWRVFARQAAEELRKSVSPDDLVVMYLCGHGLRDRRTDRWYFVTSDARYSDLMNDQYGDCIAFSDLAMLAALPCRKLAILDSCHSGAVQPLMRRDDLKSALRFLQDDVVITLTASEGDEEAAEQKSSRMGRFSAALVDGLQGKAPELDNDLETISLREIVDYVSRRVESESAGDEVPQHPTASPNYLFRTLTLPLTQRPGPTQP